MNCHGVPLTLKTDITLHIKVIYIDSNPWLTSYFF
jgi:hypothetical protein